MLWVSWVDLLLFVCEGPLSETGGTIHLVGCGWLLGLGIVKGQARMVVRFSSGDPSFTWVGRCDDTGID